MPQIINTNISSINAQRNLDRSQGDLQSALQRLSSGLRVNSARDDAAGLAISNRFITQIRGLNVAVRNANDGISLAQTTESALDEMTTALQRIRDLAVQAANDTNSDADRISLQEEVSQLIDEMDRIVRTTTFNGRNVLDGSLQSYFFQIGANSGEGVEVDGVDARIDALGRQPGAVQSTAASLAPTFSTTLVGFTLTIGSAGTAVDVLTTANGGVIASAGSTALTTSTDALYGTGVAKSLAARINELRREGQDGLSNVYANARTTFDYTDVAATVVAASAFVGAGSLAHGDLVINGVSIGPVTVEARDADGSLRQAINSRAAQTGVTASTDVNGILTLAAEDGRDIVLTTANGAEDLLFDGGDSTAVAALANEYKSGELTVSALDTITIGSGQSAEDVDNVQAMGTIANADITTITAAQVTMDSIDSALTQIDAFRGQLGAIQNRFESTIRNLSAVSESLSAANSRIKDADFAIETANLSRSQVLQQAGISVLAQANSSPQQVLSLLQG